MIPRFNIVIPTKDRAEYLNFCLKTILYQDYQNFLIIISDNSLNNETNKLIKNLKNDKIKYIKTKKLLSMRENWEYALHNIEEDCDWVTILGDDDGLMPHALKTISNLDCINETEFIYSKLNIFRWPNKRKSFARYYLTSGFKNLDSNEILDRVINNKTYIKSLPMLYTGGFAKKDLLDRIKKNQNNKVFLTSSPDIGSAISVCLNTKNCFFMKTPLAVSGTSPKSNGMSFFNNNNKFNKDESKNFISLLDFSIHPYFCVSNLDLLLPSERLNFFEHYYTILDYYKVENTINPKFICDTLQFEQNKTNNFGKYIKLFKLKHKISNYKPKTIKYLIRYILMQFKFYLEKTFFSYVIQHPHVDKVNVFTFVLSSISIGKLKPVFLRCFFNNCMRFIKNCLFSFKK